MCAAQLKRSDSYDSRNNLALLRLYQFHPNLTNRTVVENVLIKVRTRLLRFSRARVTRRPACPSPLSPRDVGSLSCRCRYQALTNLPEPCFQHALCLLPQALVRGCVHLCVLPSARLPWARLTVATRAPYSPAQQKKPTVAYLIQLERFLQTGQFKAFWAQRLAPEVEDAREMLDRVAGFDDHVRRCTLPVSADAVAWHAYVRVRGESDCLTRWCFEPEMRAVAHVHASSCARWPAVIVTALTITYQRIGVDQMKEALNLVRTRGAGTCRGEAGVAPIG